MKVVYSSEEEDYNFRARPRSRDESLNESARPLQTAKKQTTKLNSNAVQSSGERRSFGSEHKFQLVFAALLAGAAAAASVVFKRAKKQSRHDKADDAHTSTAAQGPNQDEGQKMAMRRKRSEYVLLCLLARSTCTPLKFPCLFANHDQHCILDPALKAHKTYLQVHP